MDDSAHAVRQDLIDQIGRCFVLLRRRLFFKGVMEALNTHIFPRLKDYFTEEPHAERAVVRMFLSVANEYFFYRPYPDRDGVRYMRTENDRNLRRAAALTLWVIERRHRSLLRRSEDYRALDHALLARGRVAALLDLRVHRYQTGPAAGGDHGGG